jgi:kynureninase
MLHFYTPTQTKHKILMEEYAFCSDHHIIHSQIEFHNFKIENSLLIIKGNKNHVINHQLLLETIELHHDELALILLPGVQFYTGQIFDMKQIVDKAHQYNIIVGFDLAHAVGNIPLSLHDWNVDFAAWCSYKYLNAGPGAIGGIFVHSTHHNTESGRKKLKGW